MTYDPICEEIAEHFLPSRSDQLKALAQHIQSAVEDWLRDYAQNDPASEIAQAEGCTCRWVGEGNDPDAHVRRDEWCPLHGRDPDEARDALLDDGAP